MTIQAPKNDVSPTVATAGTSDSPLARAVRQLQARRMVLRKLEADTDAFVASWRDLREMILHPLAA